MVCLAEHPALALLETLVHLEIDPEDTPARFRLLGVDVPDAVAVGALSEAELDARHSGWRRDIEVTRRLGDAFLAARSTALFKVPSVLVPEAGNVLLNPDHADPARATITSDRLVDFDQRLLR